MIVANSRLDVPSASSDLTSRSSDTVGSPASILATRDWLDLMARASPTCVTPRACRRGFRTPAGFRRRLTEDFSSSVIPRNSFGVPILQPLDSSFLRLLSRTVVLLQTLAARCNYGLGRSTGLLREDLQNYNGVGINPVDHPPVTAGANDSQLVASRGDAWHLA